MYSVSVSNCRISRWIQPPEQRPLNFLQWSQKKVVFFFVCLFYKKICSFLQCSRTTFRCTYCILSYAHEYSLLLEPKIPQSVKTNSKLAGKPILSSNIVLYFIMYVILNEFIRTHGNILAVIVKVSKDLNGKLGPSL